MVPTEPESSIKICDHNDISPSSIRGRIFRFYLLRFGFHSRALHHRSDKSLQDLAEMYNPCIRGWINYYSHFYKTQLRPTLKRIDLYVIRWSRRKFKRLRRKTKGARDWFDRLRRANPTLFAHWRLCHGNGRTSGAV